MKLKILPLLLFIPTIAICQDNHREFFKEELGIDFNNKPTVIEFWATWCGPCITALKESDSLVTKYSGRINFYAITDEKQEALNRFFSKRKFNHTFFRDSLSKSHNRYNITGIPRSLLINANGDLIWEGHSSNVSDNYLQKLLLGETIPHQKGQQKTPQKSYSLNPDKKYSLQIFPPDPDYDGGMTSSRFSDQNSFVIWPNRTLRFILRSSLDTPDRNLTFSKDLDSLLTQKSSVLYTNNEDPATKASEDLAFKVAEYYDISVSAPLVKKQVYYISSIDSSLLNQYKTILNSKDNNGIKGFSVSYSKVNNTSVMLGTGLDLKNMTYFLNREQVDKNIALYDKESEQYDLEIPVNSIEAIVQTLSEKYGIQMDIREEYVKKYTFSRK